MPWMLALRVSQASCVSSHSWNTWKENIRKRPKTETNFFILLFPCYLYSLQTDKGRDSVQIHDDLELEYLNLGLSLHALNLKVSLGHETGLSHDAKCPVLF